MNPENNGTVNLSGVEIMLIIISLVLMRGCYHIGVVAEKCNPEAYATDKEIK